MRRAERRAETPRRLAPSRLGRDAPLGPEAQSSAARFPGRLWRCRSCARLRVALGATPTPLARFIWSRDGPRASSMGGVASTVQNGVSAEREGAGGATFLELWLLRPSLESLRVVD